MSVKSSLNLTPTLSLVRRGSINLVSPLTKGIDLGCICKTEMLSIRSLASLSFIKRGIEGEVSQGHKLYVI
jgi:hypothetical protein